MRRIYLFGATFLCVTIFAIQAKDNMTRLNDKLQTTKHQNTLQLLEKDGQQQFEMLKIESLSDFILKKHSAFTAYRTPQATEETHILLDSTVTRNTDGTYVQKNIYGYNTQGKIVLNAFYGWDDVTQQWEGYHKYVFEYNNNSDLTLKAFYGWDPGSGTWQVSYKTEREWGVDSENNKTFIEIRSDWASETQNLRYTSKEETVLHGNTNYYKYRNIYNYTSENLWLPFSRFDQLFDEDGYDFTKAYYDWNAETGTWKGTSKYGYSKSADNAYTQFIADYHWNSDAWDWTTRTETEYDSNDNEIATAKYVKNGENWLAINKNGKEGDYTVYYNIENNEFIKTHKDVTRYDENGNLGSYDRYDWNLEAGGWWYLSKNIGHCYWDNLSGEWQVYQYIELAYNKYGQELYRMQLNRDSSKGEWLTGSTYKIENIYDENGKQTARVMYNWAGGEPTIPDNAFCTGDYAATATSYFNNQQSWTVNMFNDVSDTKKVWITNLVAGGSSSSTPVYGIVNDNKTELRIPVKQEIAISATYSVYLDGFYGPDGLTEIPTGESITGIINPDGTILIQDEFGSHVYYKTDGTPAGWYNVFHADGVFVPVGGKKNKYEWSFNWVEIQRTIYFYSEHDVAGNVPAFVVKVQTFPNPANDRLTVAGTKAGQTIRISNLSGQQINNYTAGEGNTIINLSTFKSGTYLVTIDNYSMKFIKK
ncbi:MAG: T9SS type A sorting domain-containing protein [Paludibacter sp.]|nr:T9SS type A sorting domain-containing protein [Paludibacter sp.]